MGEKYIRNLTKERISSRCLGENKYSWNENALFSYFLQKCLQIFHPSFCSKPGEKHKNLHIAKIYTLH